MDLRVCLRRSRAGVIAVLALALGAVPGSAEESDLRIWSDREGRQVKASLVKAENGVVSLRQEDGTVIELPLDRLGIVDQLRLEMLAKQSTARDPATPATVPVGGAPPGTPTVWPDRIGIDPAIPVTGSDTRFESPNFEIVTDTGVSREYQMKVALVFESTLMAIHGIPLGLSPRPTAGREKFRARFTDRRQFEERAGVETRSQLPGQHVEGLYLWKEQEVLVPYESFTTIDRRGRHTTDANALIHEITHQVLHDWLALMPIWMVEGMAEYMALVPYEEGSFEFRDTEAGLKATLESRYRVTDPVVILPLEDLLRRDRSGTWTGTMDEYLSAVLTVYYFLHLDGSAHGEPLAGYLGTVRQARDDADALVREYQQTFAEFQVKVDAYNEEVKRYNAVVEDMNRQRAGGGSTGVSIGSRKGSDGSITIGGGSQVMRPPAEPQVPEILKTFHEATPLDVGEMARLKAGRDLLKGRDPDVLAAAMKRAYAKLGINLQFGPESP